MKPKNDYRLKDKRTSLRFRNTLSFLPHQKSSLNDLKANRYNPNKSNPNLDFSPKNVIPSLTKLSNTSISDRRSSRGKDKILNHTNSGPFDIPILKESKSKSKSQLKSLVLSFQNKESPAREDLQEKPARLHRKAISQIPLTQAKKQAMGEDSGPSRLFKRKIVWRKRSSRGKFNSSMQGVLIFSEADKSGPAPSQDPYFYSKNLDRATSNSPIILVKSIETKIRRGQLGVIEKPRDNQAAKSKIKLSQLREFIEVGAHAGPNLNTSYKRKPLLHKENNLISTNTATFLAPESPTALFNGRQPLPLVYSRGEDNLRPLNNRLLKRLEHRIAKGRFVEQEIIHDFLTLEGKRVQQ